MFGIFISLFLNSLTLCCDKPHVRDNGSIGEICRQPLKLSRVLMNPGEQIDLRDFAGQI